MVLPIVAYGHPTLRKVAREIDKEYPNLEGLINDMFETMHSSSGVGLAAPQVNLPIRLMVIDARPFAEENPEAKGFRRVFINPYIIEESGDTWSFNEGCLSIPDIREDVIRKPVVRIQYFNENWEFQDESYDGVIGRIIQHEYDHLEGILFVDKVSSFRKVLLRRKLQDISQGKVSVDYKMIFPNHKKRGKKILTR
jgi:peptide deformylase